MGKFSKKRERFIIKAYGPGDILQISVNFLNQLHWDLNWREANESWQLFLGEHLVFTANSHAVLEAFVYGMAYSMMRQKNEFIEQTKKLYEEATNDKRND